MFDYLYIKHAVRAHSLNLVDYTPISCVSSHTDTAFEARGAL